MAKPSNSARYRDALRAELTQFDEKITALTQQMSQLDGAKDSGVEETSDYQSYLDALYLKRKAVEMKLEQLDETDDSLWDDLQAGLEEVWEDFKLTMARATEEFEAGQRLREQRQKSES